MNWQSVKLQRGILLAVGVLLVSTLGWVFLSFPLARGLERLSYDLPFVVRSTVQTPELCLVTMDEKSARALAQPMNAPWDRRLQARLVRILTEAGARAVLFDLVFDTPSADPAVDEDFAAALRESGKVYLGAALRGAQVRGTFEEQIIPPIPLLRQAAAGWGLLQLRPIDPDFGVRQIFAGTEEVPSATWQVARALGAALPEGVTEGGPVRWLNYYAPSGTFATAGFQEALRPAELPPRFFQDRVVIVGGHMSLGSLEQSKDEFMTPYTRWGQPFAVGMEIHATTLLNLVRGDWLTRMDARKEQWLVLLLGAAVSILLGVVCAFCPFRTVGTGLAVIAVVIIAACWSAWQQKVWFNWLVPAVIEVPLALLWSISSSYFMETKRRVAIRRAFSLYLSPHMAEEIAEARFDLKPGGKLVEATVMFTDLEGFTALSEQLGDPRQISDVLIGYFNNTTQHVLDNRGTIIKYIGDAVYASWGAPLQDADHAYHAVLAAWGMHQYSQLSVHGHRLVTRIGVNTGTVLAGNLGSTFRFDYTLIGDPVNLAARLEGLNKYFGTKVLLTGATWEKVSDRFVARFLGRFRVLGKQEPIAIYELLGPSVTSYIRETMELFARGLEALRTGDLAQARECLEQTIRQSGGHDGPAQYYLKELTGFEKSGLPPEWDGVFNLSSK